MVDFLGTWNFRKRLVISNVDISGNLTNFPVLIRISNSAGKANDDITDIFDEIGNNKWKMAITTGDGVTQCYVEVAEWDHVAEIAELHVRVPFINDSLLSNEFYLYFDNGQPSNTTYIGVVGSVAGQTVWDSNYVGVWHLTETSGDYKDSTSYGNDTSSIDVTNRTTPGLISSNCPHWEVDNTDLGLYIPDATELRVVDRTLEMLVRHETMVQEAAFPTLLYHRVGTSTVWWGIQITNSPYEIRHRWSGYTIPSGGIDFGITVEENVGEWDYIGGTYDTATDIGKGLYNDDAFATYNPGTTPVAGTATSTEVGNDGDFDGTMDEIRISDIVRSEAWLEATRDTLKDNLISYFDDTRVNPEFLDDDITNWSEETTDVDQWRVDLTADRYQWFPNVIKFASTGGITTLVTSDIINQAVFTSTRAVNFTTNTPAIFTTRNFTVTANVVFDLTDPAIFATRNFTVTANVVWNNLKPHTQATRNFSSQADIVWDATSDINGVREFASAPADIVWAITTPAIHEVKNFASQAEIFFYNNDITKPSVLVTRNLNSQADIVWNNLEPVIHNTRNFESTAGIFFYNNDITAPTILVTRNLNSQADIVWNNLVPVIYNTREFSSQVDIVWAITTPEIHQIRYVTSTANIVWDTASDISTTRNFSSQADIDFSITTDIDQDNWTHADSYVLNTGANVTGTIENTYEIDATYLCFDEVTGTPGFDIEFKFGLIPPEFDVSGGVMGVYLTYAYDGSPSHRINLWIWNYNLGQWDRITNSVLGDDLPDTVGVDVETNFLIGGGVLWPVANGTLDDYINNREMQIKILHTTAGTGTHDFCLDHIHIDTAGFRTEANVVFDTSSRLRTYFASTANVVFDTASDISTTREFASQADIVWETNEPHTQATRAFTSQADIVWDATSDINGVRNFASTVDIVWNNLEPPIQADRLFTSQVDIVWDIDTDLKDTRNLASTAAVLWDISTDIEGVRNFSSQADIVWNNLVPVIYNTRNFSSQADIKWNDLEPVIREERLFTSQADIVWDATSDINGVRNFASAPAVIWDATSALEHIHQFVSQANVKWNDLEPAQHTCRQFSSQAGINWNNSSAFRKDNHFIIRPLITWETNEPAHQREILLGSEPAVIWDIDTQINTTLQFSCQVDIVWGVESAIKVEPQFTSAPVITWDAASAALVNRNFSSQADIVFDTNDPLLARVRNLTSTADIVWDTASENIKAERHFASTADIIWDGASDINATRAFTSQANIIWDGASDITGGRNFASTANVVFDTASIIRNDRLFFSQADIIWDTGNPTARRVHNLNSQPDIIWGAGSIVHQTIKFASTANISWEIPAGPVNIFKENLFKSRNIPIIWNVDTAFAFERRFSVTVTSHQSDIGILWRTTNPELDKTRLPVERNFASTVNIIVTINGGNIFNMTIADLFDADFVSVTGKTTAVLRDVNNDSYTFKSINNDDETN